MFHLFNLIDYKDPYDDPDHIHPSTISSGLNSLAAIGLRDFLPSNTRAKMGDSWQVLLYPVMPKNYDNSSDGVNTRRWRQS